MTYALLRAPPTLDPAGSPRLTVRQRQLWELLARGDTNQAMAQSLGLSVKWVDSAIGLLYGALAIDTADRSQNPRVCATLLYLRLSADPFIGQDSLQELSADRLPAARRQPATSTDCTDSL